MAKFLDPHQLKREITSLFNDADKFLLIVSPYIKIPNQLKRILAGRLRDKGLKIRVIYGKNDHDISLSLNTEDMRFFQQFPNIKIYHLPDLHAKFYANDSKSIVTSLNLHRYSVDNNIEVGVLFEHRFSLLGHNDNNNDNVSTNYFLDLIKYEIPLFERQVEVKTSFFGLIKERGDSHINIDQTGLSMQTKYDRSDRNQPQFRQQYGYCIRTGVQIPFDLKKPLSEKSYLSWSKYADPHYPEKYCHFSGELTHGETCYERPILKKNWRKAMG